MNYSLIVEVAVIVFGLIGGWFTLKTQVASLKEALEDTCARLERVEQSGVVATAARAEAGAVRAHVRIDDHQQRITILEERVQSQARQVSEGLNRVETSIASMGGRLEGQLANLQRRMDEAIDQRRQQ